jgi:Na/Pi-cotransporter
MVVGFVNAGLMTLTQAVGVIFGANIGTTATAQIIAFRLESLSYPAIGIGLIISLLSRKPSTKSLGEAIMGFGLLFLGMTIMSDLLKPLSNSPEFRSYFQLFDCTPVDGVMPWGSALMCIVVGTVMTCIVQSSSATVGLVMALASQGLINFYTAVPLVLGDNIGTTITAILASLTTNRNAKRAALAHSIFNVAGAAYMYALFFIPAWNGQPFFLGLVDAITPGNVFAPVPENVARHIANAHSLFNIANCLLFLPFIGLLVKLAETIIPRSTADKETVLEYLEPHLLRTPALALEQAIHEVAYMVRRAQKSFEEGCAYFHGGPPDLERKVINREKVIDRLQSEITAYLVELSRQELPAAEAALIPVLIHAVNDTERIGDHSEELVSLGADRRQRDITFSETAERDLRQLEQLVAEEFEASHRALVEKHHEQVERVLRRQGRIVELMGRISENHVVRLESDECDIQTGVIFLDFIGHLEQIAHHLLNIAERAGLVIRTLEK